MKDFWQNLWIKLGRMGRKQFFLKHLYMILGIIVFSFLFGGSIFLICGDGNDSFGCKTIERLVDLLLLKGGSGAVIILFLIYLLSNFFLAKRFQDCGICGVRAFILGLVFPIILSIILFRLFLYNKIDFIFASSGFYICI